MGAQFDPSMLPPPGPGGPPPGGLPPGMMPPGGAMPPDMGVPPAPDEMLGSTPEAPPVTVPGWIPADPGIPVDENTCGEIGAIPFEDESGQPFCLIPPPGGLPPMGPGGPGGPPPGGGLPPGPPPDLGMPPGGMPPGPPPPY